ncbi:hypothetical protein BYT27DRAFT_6529452 [Phlegmacium glaucopus]|nr:hypothetical protein BYT27DRAFT_6529452 [Phlegmacium glaucopus]
MGHPSSPSRLDFEKKVFELCTRQAQRLSLSGGRKVKVYNHDVVLSIMCLDEPTSEFFFQCCIPTLVRLTNLSLKLT